MIIITQFNTSISEYHQKGKENYFPPIFGCPECEYEGKLHQHAYYQRNVIDFSGFYRIYISRKKCPLCGQTYSQIPDFLIPYFQYSYPFIIGILTAILIRKLSFLKVLEKLKKKDSLAFLKKQHLSFYRKRLESSRYLIHHFFAPFPKFYYKMDHTSLPLNAFLVSLMEKINTFNDFNLTYCQTMPDYFFKS